MTIEDLKKIENDIIDFWEDGDIPYLLHLMGGNEQELINIFKDYNISDNDWVFSTHRSHYHYLLKTNNEENLKKEILSGNSMFMFDKEKKFFTSSLVCGTPCIAAGVALSIKLNKQSDRVFCFIGDGAEDEGHFYEAVRFVHGHNLPCVFIIEDNNRSVESSKNERWGFLDSDVDWSWANCVKRYKFNPIYPHAGNGTSKIIKFKENNK